MKSQSSEDRKLVKRTLKSFKKVSKRYKQSSEPLELAVKDEEIVFQLPVSAFDEIEAVLKRLTKEGSTESESDTHYLSTQKAADYLGVSRPFVVRLLDSGKLPFKKVGKHRRVQFSVLKNYEVSIQKKKLKKLTEESQKMNLY